MERTEGIQLLNGESMRGLKEGDNHGTLEEDHIKIKEIKEILKENTREDYATFLNPNSMQETSLLLTHKQDMVLPRS